MTGYGISGYPTVRGFCKSYDQLCCRFNSVYLLMSPYWTLMAGHSNNVCIGLSHGSLTRLLLLLFQKTELIPSEHHASIWPLQFTSQVASGGWHDTPALLFWLKSRATSCRSSSRDRLQGSYRGARLDDITKCLWTDNQPRLVMNSHTGPSSRPT